MKKCIYSLCICLLYSSKWVFWDIDIFSPFSKKADFTLNCVVIPTFADVWTLALLILHTRLSLSKGFDILETKPCNLFLIEGALMSDCLCTAASALMLKRLSSGSWASGKQLEVCNPDRINTAVDIRRSKRNCHFALILQQLSEMWNIGSTMAGLEPALPLSPGAPVVCVLMTHTQFHSAFPLIPFKTGPENQITPKREASPRSSQHVQTHRSCRPLTHYCRHVNPLSAVII